jgi:hypothetical protein
MSREDKLRQRLKHPEDRFTERKSEGVSSEHIRKTLVAFANSLSEGEEGILFIGVSDKGDLSGVENADKLQQTVRNQAGKCYPPIIPHIQVLREKDADIVVVTVYPSKDKPHFAGPAFIRSGSESIPASRELFEELISSRNDKARLLLQHRDQHTSVLLDKLASYNVPFRYRCKVLDCNSFFANFRDESSGIHYSVSLEKISIQWDNAMNMLLIKENLR